MRSSIRLVPYFTPLMRFAILVGRKFADAVERKLKRRHML
jgi:hypothetical protein